MPTNKEFLYSLEPHELTEWFESEHGSNDTLGAKKVVSAESADANDGNVSLKDSGDDTQSFTDSREKLEADVRKHIAISITPNKDDDGVLAPVQTVLEWLDRQASITHEETLRYSAIGAREAGKLLHEQIAELQAQVDELERENADLMRDLKEHKDYLDGWDMVSAKWVLEKYHNGELHRDCDVETICLLEKEELQGQVDELTAERDALAADLKECMELNDKLSDEREKWRGTCGMMLDAAHEIENIMREMEAR